MTGRLALLPSCRAPSLSSMLLPPPPPPPSSRNNDDTPLQHLYDRTNECQLLRQAYQRISRTTQQEQYATTVSSNSSSISGGGCGFSSKKQKKKQELVLIHGNSGTGKTCLAKSIRQHVLQSARNDHGGGCGGLFLTGKFEFGHFQNPYEVFVSAFTNLVETITDQDNGNDDDSGTGGGGGGGGGGGSRCSLDSHSAHEIREVIRQVLVADRTESRLLTRMVPALKRFVDAPSTDEEESDEVYDDDDDDDDDDEIGSTRSSCTSIPGMDVLHRFQFVFSKFVVAVSSVVPLVLFVDDLQWSDPASLSLLEVILAASSQSEERPSSLLVICACQDDDDDEGGVGMEHSLQQPQASPSAAVLAVKKTASPSHARDFLARVSSSDWINVTKIALQNLNEDATNELVTDYLDISWDFGEKLGSVIFQHCQGNPFHAVQMLRSLHSHKNLLLNLHYRQSEAKQAMSDDEIDEDDDLVDLVNVVMACTVDELMRQNLSLLPPTALQVLQVAACMGDYIDHTALGTVFEGNVSTVQLALQTSLHEGFLVYHPYLRQYRFTHDRIRQAVLSTMDDVSSRSFQIGRQLWTKSTPTFLSTNLFVVANLLNHGTQLMIDQSERYRAAVTNLEAGRRAMSLAAFPDAARFLNAGIVFLKGAGGDYWKDKYNLTLKLWTAAANAELCNQNFGRVTELVTEIVKHGKTVKDTLRPYMAHMDTLGQRGKLNDAIQVGINVTRHLGEHLPSKLTKLSVFVEVFKTKLALLGRSNADLLSLPSQPLLPPPITMMHDETKIACMHTFTHMLTYAYQASNYYPVIGSRLVRMYLNHGKHRLGAIGFCVFGCIIVSFDRKEGYRLGTVALKIIDKHRAKELLPRVYRSFYGLLHHWRRPLRESLIPLEKAVKVGMQVGDVENALLASMFRLNHALLGGKSLGQVEDIANESIQQLRVVVSRKADSVVMLTIAQTFHQFIHNLTGRAPDCKILAGDIVPAFDDDVTTRKEHMVESCSPLIPFYHYGLAAELAYMFGDLDLAEEMITKFQSLSYRPSAFFFLAAMRFQEALICLARARACLSTRKKNVKNCKSILKQLGSWAKDCPNNFRNKQLLIAAELKSLGMTSKSSMKRQRKVQVLYDQAIQVALEEGFVHEAALANELAGDYSDRIDDTRWARNYLEEAHKLYLTWGATEKAKHLTACWAEYLSDDANDSANDNDVNDAVIVGAN